MTSSTIARETEATGGTPQVDREAWRAIVRHCGESWYVTGYYGCSSCPGSRTS